MKHAITSSPWGFRFWDFDRYCRFMKKTGITDVCLKFGNPEKFALALQAETGSASEYGRIATENGIKVCEISSAGRPGIEIPLAADLGARYFRICNIWENSQEMFRKTADSLKETGKIADDYGITVVVENHGGLLAKALDCRRLLEAVGLDNVMLNYDPANFLYYGEDPLSALDSVAPFVAFTHFKSVKYVDGKAEYCRLDEGVIDYKPIFEKLLSNYNGYIGLEYEHADDVEGGTVDDLRHVRRLLGS